MKCEICGTTEDVITTNIIWGVWGHNAFDFNWCKYVNQGNVTLCPDCELVEYIFCRRCDAAIPSYDYGRGYLPEDYDDEYLCPECAEKLGFELRVNIGTPPWSKTSNQAFPADA